MKRCFILACLSLSGVLAAAAAESKSVVLNVPDLKLALLVEDDNADLDLHELQSSLQVELTAYLEDYIQASLPTQSIQSLMYRSTLQRHYYGVTNLQDVTKKARVMVDFVNGKLTATNNHITLSTDASLTEESLHNIVRSALIGDDYWALLQRLLNADKPLTRIQDVQIIQFGDGNEQNLRGAQPQMPMADQEILNAPGSLLIILCILAAALFLMTLALSFYAWNKWKDSPRNTDSVSKDSASTGSRSSSDEDDDDDHDGIHVDATNAMQQPIAPSPRPRSKKTQLKPLATMDAIEEEMSDLNSSICSEEDEGLQQTLSKEDMEQIDCLV